MRPMFVSILDESPIVWEGCEMGHRGEKKTKTDRKKLETLLEIFLIVGLESSSPGLEFGFEGHSVGGGIGGRGKEDSGGRKRRGFLKKKESVPDARKRETAKKHGE
jgi:hypothetical protein